MEDIYQMAHVNVSDSNDMLFWGAMLQEILGVEALFITADLFPSSLRTDDCLLFEYGFIICR